MTYVPRSSFALNETTSAIPKMVQKKRTFRVFSFIASMFILASFVSAGAAFLYKNYLDSQLASSQAALNDIGSTDNERKIKEIEVYDNKLKLATSLLDNHLSAAQIFSEIERSTKETVQFTAFEFTYDPGFDAILTLAVKTDEFSSVALQKMQFFKDTIFSEFVLEDISTSAAVADADGKMQTVGIVGGEGVTFDVTGRFKKGILDYSGATTATLPEELPLAPVSETLDTEDAVTLPDASVVTP